MAPGELPGCLTDATCSQGLWSLLKRQPERSFDLLRAVSERRYLGPSLTLGRWLREGADGSLLPDHPEDRTFVPRRAAATKWMPFVERLRLAEIDEDVLLRVVHARLAEDQPRSKDNWTKHCTWLRGWISNGQAAIGAPRRVHDTWPMIPRAKGMKSERAPVRLVEVQRLLIACVPKLDLGFAIGLALGSGLTVAEIVGLRHQDLDLVAGTVEVREGSHRGADGRRCARVAGVPPWLVELYGAAFPGMPVGSSWLFPDPRHPEEHVTRLDGRVRCVAERLGDIDITMEGIRRVHQGILRAASASRAATRGRVLGGPSLQRTRTQATFQAEHTAITRGWRWLMSPPYEPVYVPRRAPKDCDPLQPELEASRARVKARIKRPLSVQAIRTLPASCLSGPQRDALRREGPHGSLALELLREDISLDGPRLAQRTRELAERDLKIARLEEDLERAVAARGSDHAEQDQQIALLRAELFDERTRTWESFQVGAASALLATHVVKLALQNEDVGPKVRGYLEVLTQVGRADEGSSAR